MYTVQACWEVPLQRRDVDQDQQENLLPFTISRSLKLTFNMNSKWISWTNIDQYWHRKVWNYTIPCNIPLTEGLTCTLLQFSFVLLVWLGARPAQCVALCYVIRLDPISRRRQRQFCEAVLAGDSVVTALQSCQQSAEWERRKILDGIDVKARL